MSATYRFSLDSTSLLSYNTDSGTTQSISFIGTNVYYDDLNNVVIYHNGVEVFKHDYSLISNRNFNTSIEASEFIQNLINQGLEGINSGVLVGSLTAPYMPYWDGSIMRNSWFQYDSSGTLHDVTKTITATNGTNKTSTFDFNSGRLAITYTDGTASSFLRIFPGYFNLNGSLGSQVGSDASGNIVVNAGGRTRIIGATGIQLYSAVDFGSPNTTDAITGVSNWYNSTNDFKITIQSGITAADYTLTLPTAQAVGANYALVNDGAGALGWYNISGALGAYIPLAGNTSLTKLTGSILVDNSNTYPLVSTGTMHISSSNAGYGADVSTNNDGRVILDAIEYGGGKEVIFALDMSSGGVNSMIADGSNNSSFEGIQYNATGAGFVITNQTQYSLLHRAAGDARWAPISGGTYVASVTGTANRITSSGGTTPIIDIAGTYVGQTSIITTGTLTTGATGTGFTIALGTSTITGTLTVSHGGTGIATTTAYGVITGGTTATGAFQNAGTGTSGQVLTSNGVSALPTWVTPTTGTVTAVSVASTNGFAGSSSGGATPALTLSTTVTGLLKGNGTAISAAAAGTDYQAPITLTTTGTSGAATFSANTLNIPQYQAAGTYVTSLSVTTNQGISGSFTTGATPALTLSLGALTGVTSVNGLVITANTGVVTTGTWRGTPVELAYGGTNANLTASNGGIFYSTATAGAILAGTATAGQHLQSGASGAPSWTTATFPSTATTTGAYLRANGTNWITSTLILPNAATSTYVPYATSSNTWGESANMTFDGNAFRAGASNGVYIGTAGGVNGALWAGKATPSNTNFSFQGDSTSTYFNCITGGGIGFYLNNATELATIDATSFRIKVPISLLDFNIILGTTTGTKIGTSTSQKIGAFNATPIVQPSAVTTTQGLYTAMSNLGWVASGTISGVSSYAHNISTPTTGGTVTLTNNQFNIINPVGALLALTVNLPSTPSNNDVVYIKYTQNVTTVTYGNGTVADGITAPTAGGLVVLVYDSGTTTWY